MNYIFKKYLTPLLIIIILVACLCFVIFPDNETFIAIFFTAILVLAVETAIANEIKLENNLDK